MKYGNGIHHPATAVHSLLIFLSTLHATNKVVMRDKRTFEAKETAAAKKRRKS
jgi:hypothetical protein